MILALLALGLPSLILALLLVESMRRPEIPPLADDREERP